MQGLKHANKEEYMRSVTAQGDGRDGWPCGVHGLFQVRSYLVGFRMKQRIVGQYLDRFLGAAGLVARGAEPVGFPCRPAESAWQPASSGPAWPSPVPPPWHAAMTHSTLCQKPHAGERPPTNAVKNINTSARLHRARAIHTIVCV